MAQPAYGNEHQRRRRELISQAYNTRCPLCDELMLRGQDLHLDHAVPLAVDPAARGTRIVHARCNTSAGGRLGQERRLMKPSRRW